MAVAQLLLSLFTASLYDRNQRKFFMYVYCTLHVLQNELRMGNTQNILLL